MIEKGQRSIFFKSPSIPNDEPVAKKTMIEVWTCHICDKNYK